MKYLLIVACLVVGGLMFYGSSKATTTIPMPKIKSPTGLEYIDLKVGEGAAATPGSLAVVHYTGWLDNNGEKGNKFDSSVDRKQPFEFPLGAGRVIKGWDEGVAGMKVGGKRVLYIPAALGYGARGAGNAIPPNANLIFEVELLEIKTAGQ